MKKVLLIILVLIVAISYFNGQAEEILIPENAIRFRVIANSNTYEDQALKMKVRDALQADLYFLLKDTKTEEEASQLIESSIPAFSKTIEQVLQGSNQTFQINYGMNYFPEKVYKGVKYADGDYQSLVVTLGEGISFIKDENINKYYIFLNIVEENDIIRNISIDIYNKLLNKDLPQYYIPHITLGSVDEIVDIDLNDCFETEISKITVESIGDNEESFIDFYVNLER